MNFQYTQKVLFQHCDPAGIVFYPRYFEMLNACVESWFEQKLHCSFAAMHSELKKGVPAVTVSAEFLSPSFLGDVLDFEMSVDRIGRTSLDLTVSIMCEGRARVNFSKRIVFIDSESGRPLAWPETLNELIRNYLTEST